MMTFVTMVTCVIIIFLWTININQADEMRATLTTYLLIIGVFEIATLVMFFLKADIFDENGNLESARILTMTTIVLIIGQLTFAFACYADKQLEFTFESNQNAREIFERFQEDLDIRDAIDGGDDRVEKMLKNYTSEYKELDYAVIVDEDDTVIYGSDKLLIGEKITYNPLSYYSFPVNRHTLRIHMSENYSKKMTKTILTELLTVMAASIFMTIELMLFVIKLISNRITPIEKIDGVAYCQALGYVRQIAFLFYFASRMASSFISVLALELGGSWFGITGTVLAGIPQSAETLFTCTAIFLTSMLIERKGWKLPFMAGLLLVAAGTLLSAFSVNIMMFIISRMVVGLGYGFCWMTLRNFALFGRTDQEKVEGFSHLNAGLYAGINCGSVLGSILAEKLGYTTVFVLAAVFTLLCSLMIIRLENKTYVRPSISVNVKKDNSVAFSSWVIVVLFVVLMIAPSCISASYMSYYLPIHFTDIGRGVSDVGRAQLLYGLMIIYAGPYLSKMISRYPKLGVWNFFYNTILGASLIFAGIFGGVLPAIFAALMLGFSDSFGFVSQNNYFLKFKAVQRLGESVALSYLSFIKKLAEMLGPIVFGFAISGVSTSGILIIGVIFVLFAVLYLMVEKQRSVTYK